jgi:pimeloyl-ACP methyl ester carboxylesterase
MLQPALNYLDCPDSQGLHRLAWWQWGEPDARHVVMCVHGLSRQGRDFDVLAQALVAGAPHAIRVICPDMPGRGESGWLADPMLYQLPVYAADMRALIAHLHSQSSIDVLDWVGTSMGGLIGMLVCGQPSTALPAPVRRLVLNDIGPAIEWAAIERIGTYLGRAGHFDDLEKGADALLTISAGFGSHTQEEWLALSRPMFRPVSRDSGSRWRLHYDPAIAEPFRQATPASAEQGEAALWQLYDSITARTLVLRGRDSDLLSAASARAMTERGPRPRLVEFANVGHAPTLVAPEQVACVAEFIFSP